MKYSCLCLCALLLAGLLSPAQAESYVGMTEARLIEKLGEPVGHVDMGADKTLFFRLGQVHLQDGIVVAAKLISETELADREARREALRAEARLQQENRDRARQAEGVSLRDRMLRDPAFLALGYREQIQYWSQFQTRFPDVDIEPEFSTLIAKYRALLDKERADENVKKLRDQLAEAERKAAEARREAENLRRRSTPSFFYGTVAPAPILYRPMPAPRPILQVDYKGKNVNLSYSSGGVRHNPLAPWATTPITIITSP